MPILEIVVALALRLSLILIDLLLRVLVIFEPFGQLLCRKELLDFFFIHEIHEWHENILSFFTFQLFDNFYQSFRQEIHLKITC